MKKNYDIYLIIGLMLYLLCFIIPLSYTSSITSKLENRIEVLENYHSEKHCPYCNSVIIEEI